MPFTSTCDCCLVLWAVCEFLAAASSICSQHVLLKGLVELQLRSRCAALCCAVLCSKFYPPDMLLLLLLHKTAQLLIPDTGACQDVCLAEILIALNEQLGHSSIHCTWPLGHSNVHCTRPLGHPSIHCKQGHWTTLPDTLLLLPCVCVCVCVHVAG